MPRRRLPSLLLALTAAGSTTGCSAELLLGQSELWWLWGAAPLLGFAFLGGAFVFFKRRGQVERWDLASTADEPSAQAILYWLVGVWFIFSIAFAVLNFRLEIDPGQALKNLGLWVVGSLVGSLVGLVAGLNAAEPRPYVPDPRKGA